MPATLASLRIKNFALVEELLWQPGRGFNAITGETGAGKSILIGALKLLLGERADKSVIREGSEQCTVEALFETPDPSALNPLLANSGVEPCEDGVLIVKRVLTPTGGRQFVNGSPCTLSLLRQLGDLLVDLHGPHDHQSLFSREAQTRILDEYAGAMQEAAAYRAARQEWLSLQREEQEIRESALATARELELLSHQVSEIEAANFQPGEDELLETRHRLAANARKLHELGAAAAALLTEAEPSILSLCSELGRHLREIARLDPEAQPFEARRAEIVELLSDLRRDLNRHLSAVSDDPAALAELEARLDTLASLRRKYGRTVAEIHAFRDQAAARLAELSERETRGEHLAEAIREAEKRMLALGEQLSGKRKNAALALAQAVANELCDLNFKQAGFSICLEPLEAPGAHGLELAEFVFAPNPGEPPRPLHQIASSGEISRVMLAIKCALAAQDPVSLLVFDEIDANVGGETASKVGEKMALLGRSRQVLCITHLPQVAAAASHQFLVAKEVVDGRTISRITPLDEQRREEELARMLGGVGNSALRHARSLMRKTHR